MHPVFPGIFGVTKTTAKSVRCPSLAVSTLRTRTADMSSSSSFVARVAVPRPRVAGDDDDVTAAVVDRALPRRRRRPSVVDAANTAARMRVRGMSSGPSAVGRPGK